jgi:aromatic-L-amino-acid/L-tryptophan decarboxylase
MTRDMSPGDLREAGFAVMKWIADYLEGIRELPVLPRMEPGSLAARLPPEAPEFGEPMDRILADFRELIVPATTHWNHPRFHAYFSVSASAPGILAEALTAAVNTNGMVWKSSPASTELEQVVMGWVREWLGLPESFFGIIYDTASVSTMHALAAAREFVDPDSRTRGVRGDLTVYTSEQAHSSVEKGAIAIGLGQLNVRKIAVDSEFRMNPAHLAVTMQEDVAQGKRPCCVVPTVGTTSTTSIDPIRPVVAIAKRHGAWVHVDAAYGGSAAILPELKHILDGVDGADSLVVNPHKWMFTPIDLSILFTSRRDILRQAFSLVPEYLRTGEDDRAINLMDYGVPLGRRFRALKLWFVLRYFGRAGVTDLIRSHIAYAQDFAARVAGDVRFDLAAPVPLSLVCFRLKGTDEQNRTLLDRINASGVAFLSHTVLNGQFVLRLAYGNIRTTPADVDAVWALVQAEAAALHAERANSSTTLNK